MIDTGELTTKRGIDENIKKGIQLYENGDIDKALEFFEQLLRDIKRKEERLEVFKVPIYTTLGLLYQKKSLYQEALNCYLKSLELSIKINDIVGYSSAKYQIGIIYSLTGKYKKALCMFQEYIRIRKEIGDKIGVLYGLKSLAHTYNDLGQFYSKRGELNKANQCFQKGSKTSEQIAQQIRVVSREIVEREFPDELEYFDFLFDLIVEEIRELELGEGVEFLREIRLVNPVLVLGYTPLVIIILFQILNEPIHGTMVIENMIKERIVNILKDDDDRENNSLISEYFVGYKKKNRKE